MACATEEEFISIHARPARGRPKGSNYTEEQHTLRKAASNYYYNDYECCTLHRRPSKQHLRQAKK